MNAASEGPFLHLKFGVGRPPPHEHEHEREDGDGSALLLFAHELASLDPAAHARHLHETLRTDVQRAGIARWLEQNFKEDAYIYDVVHRREGDRGMFALVTKNWARSVGDPKLHLSLYVYQDHMHVATWHAYSDRSVSYSRTGDENAPPPEGSDPYSTPEALEAAAVAALPTSFSSKDSERDDGRPRFDRPAALPTDSSDLEDTDEVPFKPEEVVQPPPPAPVTKNSNSRSSRSARKPKPQPLPEPEPESEGSSPEELRQSKKPSRRPMVKSESESDRSSDATSRSRSPSPSPSPSPPQPQPSTRSSRRAPRPPPSDAESPSSEAGGPTYPIVKSQPLGKSRSGHYSRGEAESPPPPSPKKKSERGRDRTPVSPVAQSRSPPATVSRKGETDRIEQQQQRERSRRRARPAAAPEPDPEPSPPTSRSRSPSPSPVRDSRTERGRRSTRNAAPPSESEPEQESSEKPIADVRRRDRSARRPEPARSPSPSPSQSETPPTKSKAASAKPPVEAKKDRVYERASRSSSPPVRTSRTHSKRSTRQDSEAETLKTEDERPRRGRSRAPVAPTAPPQLDRKPSWRSVSRNRHHRNGSDSSGDDTLVRGNLVDADLDIPAGGEATLLTAKRRASISERSDRRPRTRDDAFDPEEVQQPPRSVVEPPKQQTATAVLGSWIKSVGTLLKPEVEATAPATTADSEAEELEARMRRKAERAERRKARAARRAARQTDASAFEGSGDDGTASEVERVRRSSRRRPREDEPRRSRRQAETEEPASPVKPARPALRERAMSFSATLDSGFKNLRESVNKIVSGAEEPDSASSAESEVVDRRRSRHRADSRKRRENPVEESGPEHRRRRKTVEELPDQRQSRDGQVEERRSRSDRPEPTDAQRKLRERSRRREVEPEDRQDDPKARSKSAPVTSPSDEDDALVLQRRAKESAHVRSKSAIDDDDASNLPTRSSSSRAAAESSSRAARAARQTRQPPPPPRVDDSSSPERPASRRAPRSVEPPEALTESVEDREDAAAGRIASRSARGSSATADSGTAASSDLRAQYVDRNAAPDRERPRQDYEKERRGHNAVLRPRPSSSAARQSTLQPSQPDHDDFSDEPLPRRRQLGQVALYDAVPAEPVRSPLVSSSAAAFSPSPSTPSLSIVSDFAQPRRSRPSTSRPADTDADPSRGGDHPGRGNLTDEEEESRFIATRGGGSSSTAASASPIISDRRTPSRRTTVTRERREEGEYIPPIPAPAPRSNRNTLPAYDDSGPLRPQPHRAAHRQQPRSSGPSTAGLPDSHSNSNSSWDGKRDSSSRAPTSHRHLYETSLPRTASFSRSQPAFDPVSAASSSVADSDSDSDSESQEEDGEATSDPDSVAFRRHHHQQPDRQQQQTRMDDWNDSRRRGRRNAYEPPPEEEGGSVRPPGLGDYDPDGFDDDDDDELFRSAAVPLSSRSAPPAASSLSRPSMMNYHNRRRPDAAPSATASSSSSRTNMFGAAPDPPSRTTTTTTTKSRTMVSARPLPPPRMPDLETADRGGGGWRDLLQQQSGSHSPRPLGQPGLGLGSLAPSSSSSTTAQDSGTAAAAAASFDRLTAKGRESGSVQLFGRHNAPVSRRMARRLGMS